MKQKSWYLNRRDVLKGVGFSLALPTLEAMAVPSSSDQKNNIPKRMVVCYISYGVHMPNGKDGIQKNMTAPHDDGSWWPCSKAGDLTFNKSSKPFEPLKNYVSYLEGLDHEGGWKCGGHSSGDVFATGAFMGEHETTNNISIDQVAAKIKGKETRYPSLVLGTEGGIGAYGRSNTLSHYGPGRPIPSLDDPFKIFNSLFRPYSGDKLADVRTQLLKKKSMLDLVLKQAKSLSLRLGKVDQAKMEEYFISIREIEQRLERMNYWSGVKLPNVNAKDYNLNVSKSEPENYIRCLYDLIHIALQTDVTRFASFMLESEQSTSNVMGTYSQILFGYKGNTHDISHKRPADVSAKWDNWRAKQHAYFLDKLKNTQEGNSNMLDNTVVLWGSAHPHNSHSTRNYPIQVAGGNELGFKHGKLHKFTGNKKVPLANLFLSMLHSVDVPVKKFADSTAEMSELR